MKIGRGLNLVGRLTVMRVRAVGTVSRSFVAHGQYPAHSDTALLIAFIFLFSFKCQVKSFACAGIRNTPVSHS